MIITHRDINPFARKLTPMYYIRKFIHSTTLTDKMLSIISYNIYIHRYLTNLSNKVYNQA